MKKITADMLEDACEEQLDEFTQRFPNGMTFKSEADAIAQCTAVAGVFEWGCAARNLLDYPEWKTFRVITSEARRVYREAIAPAVKAYDKAIVKLYKSSNEAKAQVHKAYDEAMSQEWAIYKEESARTFAVLFYQQGDQS